MSCAGWRIGRGGAVERSLRPPAFHARRFIEWMSAVETVPGVTIRAFEHTRKSIVGDKPEVGTFRTDDQNKHYQEVGMPMTSMESEIWPQRLRRWCHLGVAPFIEGRTRS